MNPPFAPNIPVVVPDGLFRPGDFANDVGEADLVLFLVNVGDGDMQLVLLPSRSDGTRRAVVVDVADGAKLAALLESLAGTPLLPGRPEDNHLFPLVVATHPHADHIGGMAHFLASGWGTAVRELWAPGCLHTSQAYLELMRALEDADPRIHQVQPASGATLFLGRVRIQAVSPSVALVRRLAASSHSGLLDNASIALRIELPIRPGDGKTTRTLLLGADALLLAWDQALHEFQELRAHVLKVPQHASKDGVDLRLVQTLRPDLFLVSSVGGGGDFNFPDVLALEAIRWAVEPRRSGGSHRPDFELGLHYTAALATDGPLGSLAVVVSPDGGSHIWRFGDRPDEPIDLARARRFNER